MALLRPGLTIRYARTVIGHMCPNTWTESKLFGISCGGCAGTRPLCTMAECIECTPRLTYPPRYITDQAGRFSHARYYITHP